ncbi:UvrD-helicase domain-containing protein [Patulibacter americanus]|uniref:UvrD-helicase domain-containing protein n=1 Tax=Patulibacter americanus TaxID=588672 RepID=UPI0003B60868|nr:UvrD-helicase domain-containing protein [Patulibacter americanus]
MSTTDRDTPGTPGAGDGAGELRASPVDRRLLYTDDGGLRRALPVEGGPDEVFSDRQAAAIERQGETLVSAGAGAGKTSVLVERYLRLLEGDDRLSTGSVLAITFTDKAAAEMRERVRRRLEALVGGRVELPERWRLEDAWIGTFHGIAQRLLRRYALAAGIDPDAEVADEGRARELRHVAFERALSAWLADPARARGRGRPDRNGHTEPDPLRGPEGALPADADAALALAASSGLDALRDDTLGLLALRRTQGRDPATTPGRALPAPPEGDDDVRAAVRRLRAAAGPAQAEAEAVFEEGKSTPAGQRALDLVHDTVAALHVELPDPDAPAPVELPSAAAMEGWALPTRQPKVGKGPAVGELRAAVEDARELARARELAPHGERELRLREALLVATAREYRRAKRERALVDFDDLLLALLELLRRRPDVAGRLRARFQQVLVDEYQDTNPVQLELVERLSNPESRFQVGDRLQAIYGFRHATVAGFDAAAARADAAGGRLALDETFRCPSDVLALANRVGVPAHEGYQPLVGGHDRAPKDERPTPPVEIHVLAIDPSTPDAGQEAEGEAEEAPVAPGEPEYVAGVVSELVAQGRRPAEIAILVRRTAPVEALGRALLDRGIDAVPVVATPLLRTLEARELEAWLRAVANPLDDVALMGALRLPTAGVDADALVPLAAEHGAALELAREAGRPAPVLWDTLRELGLPGRSPRYPMSEDARDELDLQAVALARHRGLARRAGPAELLADLRGNDAYRASILARPGGARRWATVEAFVAWAEEQEEAGDDLPGLLRRIAADRDGPDAPVLTDGDAVRITTVHRSKGLEWPVVIVCDLGARINADRPGVLVGTAPEDTRIGLRLPAGGSPVRLWDYDALTAEADRAQAEEERRLVHVATTRAKERLILCGGWPLACEGTGSDREATDRLDPERAVAVAPGGGHDAAPRTAPLRWLLPLVAPEEAWPSRGDERLVPVTDPTGAVTSPAEVLLRAVDPAEAAPTAPAAAAPAVPAAQDGDAGDAEDVGALGVLVGPGEPDSFEDEDDEDGFRPGPPPLPLPDPVSYTALAARLGLEVDPGDVRHERPADPVDEEPAEDDPAALPAAPPATLFTTASLDGRARGVAVHGLLEARLSGPARPGPAAAGPGARGATPDDARRILAEEAPGLGPVDEADARALVAIAARLEATDVARRALALPPARRHVERPFLFDPGAGRPLLQGVVDLWLDEDDGRVTIADWKTNRLQGRSPQAVVDGHYALQRDVYALAALLSGARGVEVQFVFAEAPDEPASAVLTADDLPALRERVGAEIDRAARTVPRG